jgi:hypothetical protein
MNTPSKLHHGYVCQQKSVANLDPREVSICILPDSEGKTVTEEKTKKERYKGVGKDECEEEVPGNPPCAGEQEPPEDGWFCPQYSESPLSVPPVAEEEIERIGTL